MCSWKFRKFRRKTLVLESPFNKVAGLTPILKKICQQLLLHYNRTTQYPFYFIFSAFFLITATTVNISDVCFGSNSKGFKEFKSGISFSLKSLSLLLLFSMFFLSFSVLLHSFLLLLIIRILLSWGLIKPFLPTLTSLKYVHVSK